MKNFKIAIGSYYLPVMVVEPGQPLTIRISFHRLEAFFHFYYNSIDTVVFFDAPVQFFSCVFFVL